MRRAAWLLMSALVLGACSGDESPTGVDPVTELEDIAGMSLIGRGSGIPDLAMLGRLPDSLKLTAEQRVAIQTLIEQHMAATKADHDALQAIIARARAAQQAGKSREEIRAILEEARPIHERLAAAGAALRTAIENVLTAEQKAWLASQQGQRCDRTTAPPLTEAQRTEIRALIQAFESQTAADREAIRLIMQEARDAHQNGASREEIAAIIARAQPAIQRVEQAHQQLYQAIQNLLTAEQRASGCYSGLGGAHVPPPGGRHR